MKKIRNIFILMLGLILLPTACTEDFEEINTDPNNPTVAPSINILANVIRYHTQNFYNAWGDMNEPATYANHLGKIQYIDEAAYRFREGVVNNLWYYTYVNINDLQIVIEREMEEGGNPNLAAMAMTLRAYMFQIATDRWKAIPYSQAGQADEGITNPEYDSQESIYYNLLDQLQQANGLYDYSSLLEVGPNDVLFGGDLMKWQRFTNAMRMRVATRMSDVAPGDARTHIEQILTNPETYPLMLENEDNAYLWWEASGTYREPWQADTDDRDDHGMATTMIETLQDFNDPRLAVYAKPADSDGEYRGVIPGAIPGSFALSDISRIGSIFRDIPDGFTPIMRAAEVHFAIAEAAFNEWNTAGVTAQDAYEEGIRTSLAEYGLEDTFDDYITQPGVAWEGDVEQIYLQKWIALFKNGEEAWALTRRTDVPELGHAPHSPYVGQHNRPPFRYPYPTDELNLNSANIQPHLAGIVNQFWGQQMWWDTRTGVN